MWKIAAYIIERYMWKSVYHGFFISSSQQKPWFIVDNAPLYEFDTTIITASRSGQRFCTNLLLLMWQSMPNQSCNAVVNRVCIGLLYAHAPSIYARYSVLRNGIHIEYPGSPTRSMTLFLCAFLRRSMTWTRTQHLATLVFQCTFFIHTFFWE